MTPESLLERSDEFKNRLRVTMVAKKKLKALMNYSEVAEFEHKPYLELIDGCLKQDAIGHKEVDFLSYMLDKYKIYFLDWAYRNPWLREKMAHMRQGMTKQQASEQLEMFEERTVRVGALVPDRRVSHTGYTVPAHLIQYIGIRSHTHHVGA